jgi:hypothetical protein
MNFRTCDGWIFLRVVEHIRMQPILWHYVKIRNQNFLIEADEPEPELIQMPMRVLNLTEGFRLTEAAISLSADSGCNEERAAATGQRIVRMIAFLLWEDSERKTVIYSDSFTTSLVRNATFVSRWKRLPSWWLVYLFLLAVGFNKYSRTLWCKFQFCHSVKIKYVVILYICSGLVSSVSLKALFSQFQKCFRSSFPVHLCSETRRNLHPRTYEIYYVVGVWASGINCGRVRGWTFLGIVYLLCSNDVFSGICFHIYS